jgi:hypothetical protein
VTNELSQLGRCIKSAADNFNNRMPSALYVLEDIESDLEGALKAVKALIAREVERQNEIFN